MLGHGASDWINCDACFLFSYVWIVKIERDKVRVCEKPTQYSASYFIKSI